MKVSINVYSSKRRLKSIRSSYFVRVFFPLQPVKVRYSWYSNTASSWWSRLGEKEKREIVYLGSENRFVKDWQEGTMNKGEFYRNICERISTDRYSCDPLFKLRDITFVFSIFSINNTREDSKQRSSGGLLEKIINTIIFRFKDILGGPYIGFFDDHDQKYEYGSTVKLIRTFTPEIAELGGEIWEYWKNYLEYPLVDSYGNMIDPQNLDVINYYLLMRIKFAYVVYQLYPDDFAKMYPSA